MSVIICFQLLPMHGSWIHTISSVCPEWVVLGVINAAFACGILRASVAAIIIVIVLLL
jgi:hypothetical protein